MKKVLAVLSVAAIVFSFASCGSVKPDVENTTTEAVLTTEAPTAGRVDEKEGFYVYIPEDWCKMEYESNGYIIRMFDTPSAPDIKDDTPEIEIDMSKELGTDTKAEVEKQMKNGGAKAGKAMTIGESEFSCITYMKEKRVYTVYVGTAHGQVCKVTLKGVKPESKEAQDVLKSISFKAAE